MPALFPFKRQQEGDEGAEKKIANKNSSTPVNSPNKPNRGLLSARRKKKKDADRQMISIDGKQYYVDDDGELKELKEEERNDKSN